MHFAASKDGVKLAYHIDDFTDPWANAPYILLMHGLARSSAFWYQWVPYIARHYKIIRPDMRGFGQSRDGFTLQHKFDLDVFTEDVLAVLDAEGIDRVHFCGEAFGGVLGTQFAATHPDRVRTLDLVGAPVALGAEIRKKFAHGGSHWGDTVKEIGIRAWVDSTNKLDRFPAWMEEGFFDWYSSEIAKGDLDTLVAFAKITENYDQSRFLPAIDCPVLGIYPDHRQEHVVNLKKGVRDLTIQNISVKYSLFNFVHPRETALAVLNFVALKDGRILRE
jgi:3-oxoadipate enol-lactonase